MTITRGLRLSADDKRRLHRFRRLAGPYRKAGRMSRWTYSYIPPSRVHIWWGPNGGKVKVIPTGGVELTAPTGEVAIIKSNGGTISPGTVLRLMAVLHMISPVTAGRRFQDLR
ncbi:hypothetical protein [Actinoplanes sp. NPDC049265]|uniref:hypothetical protein n=1 Tax=Actinoplanes sp. NPDC049265 TaxID=3363902 RepID=UPI00371225EE